MSSDLPAGWQMKPLGEVMTLKRGYDLPARLRRDGSVPIVSSSGISGLHDKAKVPAPGVVTGRYGTLGEVFFVEHDFWPLNTALYVQDFKGSDPLYCAELLRTINFRAYDGKSGVPGINRNDLHTAEVAVATREDQARIAYIASALDARLASNERLSDKLERLACTLVERLMATPAARAWPETTLGEVLGVLETGNRPKGGVKGITEGVPSIGAESIVRAGVFDFAKVKFVPRSFYEKLRRGHLRDGDVLLYKDGGKPGDFRPHVSMIGQGFPFVEAAINEHVYRLRIKPPYSQEFLYAWLQRGRLTDEMRRRGTGVAIPGLNTRAVKELPMVMSDLPMLSETQETITPLMAGVFRYARESRILRQVRATLLPALVTGRASLDKAMDVIDGHRDLAMEPLAS